MQKIFSDIDTDEDREGRLLWLKAFHESVRQAADEEMPDFTRTHFDRELVDLSD